MHKVVYFSGPGNIVNTFRLWLKGEDDPHQQAITYSGQFYSAAKNLSVELTAISQDVAADSETDGVISAKNHITLWHNARGVKYFLGRFIRGFYIFSTCLKLKPNVLFVTEGNTFWFMLALPKLIGVKVVPVLHCTLWLPNRKKSMLDKIFDFLDKPIYGRHAYAVLTVSLEITKQVKWLRERKGAAETDYPPVVEFLPSYRETAASKELQDSNQRPFYVLFVSRIQAEKGIYDLIELAKKIKQDGFDIKIDVAGDGSDFEAFKKEVAAQNLEDILQLHGYCYKDQMRELVARSHAFIVMTTDNFIEGFNKVCLESVLSCRPLIASSACPAIAYMEKAAIVVKPGDVSGYFQAIVDLYQKPELYNEKSESAKALHPLFLSQSYSFESAIGDVIASSIKKEKPSPRIYNAQS